VPHGHDVMSALTVTSWLMISVASVGPTSLVKT
jgi:hypothetical protein